MKKQQALGKTGYIKLQQNYKGDNNDVHIFVEDEDDYEFYRNFIEYIYRDFKILPYFQKGKKHVIESYYQVDWDKFCKSKVLFFVDKDFDDLIAKENPVDYNFFITKFYSIENYLVTDEFFEILFSRIIKIRDERLISSLIDKINIAKNQFYHNMIPITSLILIYRKKSAQMKLDNLSLSDYMKIKNLEIHEVNYCKEKKFNRIVQSDIDGFSKSLVRKNKKLTEIITKCEANPNSYNLAKLLANRKELLAINCEKKFIRGKYELWFLFEMLKSIDGKVNNINNEITKLNNTKDLESEKTPLLKKSFNIDVNNIFHIFPAKIKMPEDIEKFLTLNFNKI
ncbi:DUF4435 domain-containing protein [Tenacibaculum maritimum]|uniref:DUF4435 domain-containing protein n=1 Tax=Tenacibaculum maritimum TaxID=107401 RepID=UPI001330CE2C|nr:DUF4435 domain-containing protein [Tenacibaculum maritimum]